MFRLLRAFGLDPALSSFVCQSKHFDSNWYRRWALKIAKDDPDIKRFGPNFARVFAKVWDAMAFDGPSPLYRHRKMWEWCAISQALDVRGMLARRRRGCGFAVGHEPLPSLFASLGAHILATDLRPEAGSHWANSGEHCDSLENLHWPNLIRWSEFSDRVSFRPVDMRIMDGLSNSTFDFVWSSCALEHLGSLEAGIAFIERSTDLLKPGGVGIHTTEFNISSERETLESGETVIYRKSDITSLAHRIAERSAALHALNFEPGNDQADLAYDEPPYYVSGRQHVKLRIGRFVSASIILIVQKNR
jgi:hypothetical protein